MNKFFLISVLWMSFNVDGQTYINLTDDYIQNSSFEEYYSCPTTLSYYPGAMWVDSVVGWHATSQGTSDYYNICGSYGVGVPSNSNGYQETYHGNAYCGFLAYAVFPDVMWSEYLETQLIQPLKANTTYRFSMQIARSSYGNYAASKVGINFSNASSNNFSGTQPLNFTPTILNNTGFLTDTTNWTRISGEFTAIGDENYLTIGWFGDTLTEDTITVIPAPIEPDGSSYPSSEVYYFVDSLSLFEVDYSLDDFSLNVLTPNDDGINDAVNFTDYFLGDFNFIVLNRWGNQVFATNQDNPSWDGKDISGNELSEGTYFYVLTVKSAGNKSMQKHGFIYLAN